MIEVTLTIDGGFGDALALVAAAEAAAGARDTIVSATIGPDARTRAVHRMALSLDLPPELLIPASLPPSSTVHVIDWAATSQTRDAGGRVKVKCAGCAWRSPRWTKDPDRTILDHQRRVAAD